MASYTTPRTGNVGDSFTAAWYNSELRDNLKWLHDTLLSQGAVFPTSPLPGQRHLFVSGVTRLMFTYDGSNWISDELASVGYVYSHPEAAPGLASSWTGNTYVSMGVDNASETEIPVYDVADALGAGVTLQGKLEGYILRTSGSGATTGSIAISVSTAALDATWGAAVVKTAVAATVDAAGGWGAGAWGDLASGAVAGVRLDIAGKTSDGSGSTTYKLMQARLHLRFKK